MQVKILSATHKLYPVPEDEMYVPLQVNSAANGHFTEEISPFMSSQDVTTKSLHAVEKNDNIAARANLGVLQTERGGFSSDFTIDIDRYRYDDTGDNISIKNPYYCELTALYWGWKNLDCDYLGLVHYRRYFIYHPKKNDPHENDKASILAKDHFREQDNLPRKESSNKCIGQEALSPIGIKDKTWKKILSGAQAQNLLKKLAEQDIFVILPQKRYYIIETLYSHYAHSHHEADLIATTDVIHNYFPDYTAAYVEVMKRRSSHMFNMCIMRKDILDAYCTWLFDVLEKVEAQLDISRYTDFDKRVFGRISELLLDVWITKNKVPYYELPIVNLEGENWLKKIPKFLRRKLRPEHKD